MSTSTNLGWDVPDNGADDDTWGTLLIALLTSLDGMFPGATSASTIPNILQNYLSGLTLSTAGSSATFGIAAGVATDSANGAIMRLASAYTKTTSSWAVGTGNGSLDTGSIANSTWYHVWLIQRSDTKVVDVLISTSATSPTMPASYDRKRRIGAMKTNGSAQWTSFTQLGDRFLWLTPVKDASAASPSDTNAITMTLTVPTGVKVGAIIAARQDASGGSVYGYYSSLDQTDLAASDDVTTNYSSTAFPNPTVHLNIRTNTNGQIRGRFSGTGVQYTHYACGWDDARGKDA